MKQTRLTEYFTGFAFKRLTATEVDPKTSKGHEFQGISVFRDLFGRDRRRLQTEFVHLGSSHEDGYIASSGELTWYNSRENQPTRSPEFRLYYRTDLVQTFAKPEDLCVVALTESGETVVLIAEGGTTFEYQLKWLFGIEDSPTESRFQLGKVADDELDFASKTILESLGFELLDSADDYLEELLAKFGRTFPSTKEFSEFARRTVDDVSPAEAPDHAYLTWIEREETLFRTFERELVAARLREGFGENGDDVDDFVKFSLSVQNRRKSRVGHALENHLDVLLEAHSLRYTRNGMTENRSRPDFVFPDIASYHDAEFPTQLLTVLGVKSTCKDRWRQVLAEAARLKEKHLLTLEPSISEHQTDEMKASSLQLVIPRGIHRTYTEKQQKALMSLEDFLSVLKEKQQTS